MEFLHSKLIMSGVRTLDLSDLKADNSYRLRHFFNRLARSLKEDCQIQLNQLCKEEKDSARYIRLIIESMMQGGYSFDKRGFANLSEHTLYEVRDSFISYPEYTIYLISDMELSETIKNAVAMGLCCAYARMLGDLPYNYMDSKKFCDYAAKMIQKAPLSLTVLKQVELVKMECGGILAVNQASSQEAGMLVLKYIANEEKPVTALVGKGIFFDSGGYHLKSIHDMEGMKYDMCGAANVLCLMEYLAQTQSACNVMAVIPIAENVLAPDGVKMGDVIRTMSGKTVEVYNTDAEGRLLLSDALTYACRHAKTVLDFATLTYSCKNALGDKICGVFCNCDTMYDGLQIASERCGEKIWRLPLDEIYKEELKWSKTADLANYAPGKGGGASVAACFLSEFIEPDVKWAHFDMVGPAVWKGDSSVMEPGASGTTMSTAAAFLTEETDEAII